MNDQPVYNLATEPWIGVRLTDGTMDAVGWRDLLLRSAEISDVVVDPVLAYPVILRFAAAMVLRSHDAPLASPSHTDWRAWAENLLESGLDAEKVNRYFDDQSDAFWLIHPERPFLQDAAIAGQCKKSSTTNKLRIDVASGNNAVWGMNDTFDASAPTLSHRDAAVHLCVQWGYGSGGRCASRSGVAKSLQSPLRNRTVFMPLGGTLWETLLLQCVPAPDDHELSGNDYCQWERPPREDSTSRSGGTLTRLTGSPRGLLLVGDEGGVYDAYLTWGEEFGEDVWERETASALKINKKGERFPYKVTSDRSAWADAPALLASLSPEEVEGVEQPACLNPAQHPLGGTLTYFDSRVRAITHFSDKSKDESWSVATSHGLVHAAKEIDPDLYGAIRQFCLYADEIIRTTLGYANNIKGEAAKGETRLVGFKVATVDFKRRLWHGMESSFATVLAGANWSEEALAFSRTALDAFDQQTSSMTAPDAVAAVALTRRKLTGSLYKTNKKFGLTQNTEPENTTSESKEGKGS